MNSNHSHLVIHAVSKFKDNTGKDVTRWTRVGAAFPNSKGGFQIKLELVPVDPNIDLVALPPKEREDE